MKPSERMRIHVTAIAAIVKRMDPGVARDRVQRRLEQTKSDYEALRAKEER